MSSFEGENMQTQYNVLGYRIELYFYDYKLAMKMNKSIKIFTIKSKEKNQ